MNTAVRRKLEMAARVLEFSRAHPSTDPGYELVLREFEERLTRAGAIAARQKDGQDAARSASARRRELRAELHFQIMHYLVAVGEVASKVQTDLAERFKLPSTNLTYQGYITAVKVMLAVADTHRELLVSKGMGATLLEELGRRVAEFEAVNQKARTSRRDHIGARLELDSITSELQEQVKVLNGMNRFRFGKDPQLLGEWNAVRHVPGLPRPQETPSAEAGEVPPNPGSAAPAA